MALSLTNINVTVANKLVVKKVNLTIKTGECHVLLGPNGSGKTSLAYALTGHPDYLLTLEKSGQVLLDNKSLVGLAVEERARAGLFMAFQHPVEISGVTVWTFLKAAVEASHGREKTTKIVQFRRELEDLTSQVGLPVEFLNRGLNEGMSGGEKKRMELLQLLVLKPKYAILDETDSGLDIDAIKQVADTIRGIKKTHKTGFLVITHYQKLARLLVPDMTHVMVGGSIVAEGNLELVNRVEAQGYAPWQKVKKEVSHARLLSTN